MGNIYRKASIDRLASPEQLDKMIRIASPSLWIAVAGAGLVVVCVLVWAIFGRLPENVSVSGLYMTNTGNLGNYATYGGTVTDILVQKNQEVQPGDVLAVVKNEDTNLTVAQLQERIAAVEGVTLTSKKDTATSDNTRLLEYKLQYQQAGLTLEEKQANLQALNEQLEKAKKKAANYKSQMDAAENAYLAAVGDDGANAATFNYQAAQTDLTQAQSRYQTAASTMSALQEGYASAKQAAADLDSQYTALKNQYESLESTKNTQNTQLITYENQYSALKEQYPEGEVPEEVQQQLADLESSMTELKTSLASVESEIQSASAQMTQLENSMAAQSTQLQELENQLGTATSEYNNAQMDMNDAQAAYDSAESVYGSYYSSQSSRTAEQSRLNTDFSEASSLYSNAYSEQLSLEQQIESLKVTKTQETKNKKVSQKTLKEQFEAAKEATLKDLKAQLATYSSAEATDEIKAKTAGTVVDIPVQVDQIVGQGTELVKIKSNSEAGGDSQIVRCYVPLAEGKKLKEGMDVVVTPSTVSEQEYGHMMAEVTSVGTYTVSASEMQRMLGDDVMVQGFQQQGPCVEVLISLKKDDDTVSGYAWSNRKGETVELAENTPISAKVRIKENAPISKLIPFLKSKLDVNVASETAAN
ncbi:MAG: HlyD family efflux transporter periplasmic adaptor subunit [Blautia sp.]